MYQILHNELVCILGSEEGLELTTVCRPDPWQRRDVGEVARVEVAIGRVAKLLSTTMSQKAISELDIVRLEGRSVPDFVRDWTNNRVEAKLVLAGQHAVGIEAAEASAFVGVTAGDGRLFKSARVH